MIAVMETNNIIPRKRRLKLMIDLNENAKKLENLKKRLYEMGDSL